MSTNKSERRKFRDGATREALAIEPRAWGRYFECSDPPPACVRDGIAYVWISGPLEHHAAWWWMSYDQLVREVESAFADESARAVVLCIDSPGGAAAGMIETHRKLRALREKHDKPLFAFANECAASAAYGIACAADVIYLPETGHVGSVGVIACIVDQTARNEKDGYDVRLLTTGARKGDGHPDKPLDDDSLAALQAHVDTIGASFFEIVSESRAMSITAVSDLEAAVFYGADAINAGLADGIASFDAFMSIVRAAADGLARAEVSRLIQDCQRIGSRAKGLEPMDKPLALKLKIEETKTALLTAKTEKDQRKALAAYDLAVEAASKYKKTVVEEEESDEDEKKSEGEDDDDEADADKKSDEDDDKDDDDTSTQDSTAAEKDAKEALEASNGLYTYARLFRLARQTAQRITGKTKLSIQEIFGAIDGAGESSKTTRKLEARLEKLEGARRTDRVKTLLTTAKREGRVTPAEAKQLEGQDPKWLAGYLATKPKGVRTLEDGELAAVELNTSDPMAGLSPVAREIVERNAARTGRTVAEEAKDLADKTKASGASPARH